ncbi:hypothetical protein I3760_05G055100 [Carya illinoinensis]|uniref:Phytocyanin domain-containing protein n=1 Tax=Carya illinoinensis TaxID=32201 RepID=A0A8T1QG09_CARIL|nr:uncharacterized protein LOC122309330 [Carya illinoinensis]KAG2705471.1 hypothetical protein I3760_05G055100 [Carya illinoinensis]KAG6653142.1 hypothetical protein CIPAW_05G054400 [Carya illinoinensis]KAG6711464.1 hypothetical protein I3842_05G054600 [Carya illinoinensis]
MGGFSFAHGFVLMVATTILSVSFSAFGAAEKGQQFPELLAEGPKRIVVGGETERWRTNLNYTDWALKNGQFYVNDTLVFKYDPPNVTANSDQHSVYLLPDMFSFRTCNLKRATMVGNVTQGGGEGFQFVLEAECRRQTYYFACGEKDHCTNGQMKFTVTPDRSR